MKKYPEKKYPTIGVCGLDCGLCPRFYTAGPSRCPGCAGQNFFNKHPSCSFITCAVREKGLEVCSECTVFPCSRFRSEAEYQQIKESSSYPSCKSIISNLIFIKEYGIEKFIMLQDNRIRLLKILLRDFDDGRSKSFFCKSAGLIDLPVLEGTLSAARLEIKRQNIQQENFKSKAKIIRNLLNENYKV